MLINGQETKPINFVPVSYKLSQDPASDVLKK